MRILVTGGTGLIGRALVADVRRDAHEVVVLSRNPARAPDLAPGVEVQPWDGRTVAGWGPLVNGVDAVVNLAGENISSGRWTAAHKARIVQSRLDAGRALVQAIAAATYKPRVLIQASAVGYYGPRGAEALTEDAPPGEDWLAQLAVEWEAVTRPVEDVGVRRAVIRTGVVLTRAGGALPKMALPFRFFVGGPVGSGRQILPWIHHADVVAAIRFLIDHADARGPFNLTAPEAPTNAEFGRALGRAMRRPAWLPVPGFALRLLFGEMATVLLTGQRAVPAKLQQLGFTFRFPMLDAALADIFNNNVPTS
ncbi:MAG TPA: TIGR01777 family oxidoreductase [Anaerolineae bacterium]|nr:TIGR01777 family oxidoreductase [Anaerolineae bacterium]HQI85881.1 TIGR01777 family oxidoreductase [Anaerolineae bacterium]